MSLIVGSARIDENGHVQGGKPGDQTGKEVSTQVYYVHTKGWYWNEVQAGAGGRRYIGAFEQSADGTGKNQGRTERSEERTGL